MLGELRSWSFGTPCEDLQLCRCSNAIGGAGRASISKPRYAYGRVMRACYEVEFLPEQMRRCDRLIGAEVSTHAVLFPQVSICEFRAAVIGKRN